MLLAELTATSEAVRATPARNEKIGRLAETLRRTEPGEVAIAVAYLSGELRQRQIGVGYRSLRDLPAPATEATLSLSEVDATCEAIGAMAGPGSQAGRRDALAALFARATEAEQRFLIALLTGELRQGAQEGVMVEAVARAAEVPRDAVRRACMLSGDLGATAAAALSGGAEALRAVGLEVGRPVQPMLAAPGDDVDGALAKTGPAAIEYKLDGARLQVHRRGDDVRAFTRSLDDITARVPEVVEAVLALPAREVVLDGEAIALKPDGRPYPFQVTASRFGTRRADATAPLTPLFFDVLHVDGEDLIDRPGAERAAALDALVPAPSRVPRALVANAAGAHAFLDAALAAGHEGVLVEVAGGALRRRAPRRRVAEGQAAPHARPRRAGRRVGPRPPPRVAEQPAPRGPRSVGGRLRHARQDVQGPHRRHARLADRAPARARDRARRLDRPRPPRARRRDRLRRCADEPALPGRRHAALRARDALPRATRRRPMPTRSTTVLAVHAGSQ